MLLDRKGKLRIFGEAVVNWGLTHSTDFPWRRTKDPYRLLVAEVMLQRTRADQVVRVYEEFTKQFPTIESVEKADLSLIEGIMQPLGLHYRAKRLKNIMHMLLSNNTGRIPSTVEEFESLTGVGRYIASAVICFAYGGRVAVIDTNVIRILARVFSYPVTPNSHKQGEFLQLAESIISSDNPQIFNWAMIDIGRTICTTSKPKCIICPLRKICDFANS